MVGGREPLLRTMTNRRDQNANEALEETEVYMIFVSLGLLLLTCVQTSPVREIAVIAWLVSLVLVGLRNPGAVLGIYVAAVALYANGFSTFSIFGRPDRAAMAVLFAEIGLLRMRNKRWFFLDR
ncbi:MAG: hypothetical protein ACRDIB_14425, partial [Ardenticatenaceae bacterium]